MPKQTIFEINGRIQDSTEKAVRFSDDDETWVWLPLSQIEIEEQADGTFNVIGPEWLFKEKGLI